MSVEAFSFEVSVKGAPWPPTLVIAYLRGAAKYNYWLDVRPADPFHGAAGSEDRAASRL